MADTFDWSGATGQQYTYSIHDLEWVPAADQDGNYIFAKKINAGWEAVYVGEGDLQSRRAAALDEGCAKRKGATHYHCHLNQKEEARLAEETDVLKGNPEAYEPVGCNTQP